MKTLSWSVGIALLAAVCVTNADAATVKCQRTIAKASSQYVQARVKALYKCEENIVKGNLSQLTVCTTESKTAASITKARGKLTDAIGKSCGGDDKVCGGNTTNEDTPASLGWPSACPNFESGSCNNQITASCDGIATCLKCVGEAAVDQAINLYYDDLVPNTTDNKALNKCQIAIGKATSAFLTSKTKALQQCWDGKLNEKGNICAPLTSPNDDKPIAAIAKAEDKKIATICKACGGADQSCDDVDDFTPAQIGFPAHCPAVTIPGVLPVECGAVITNLQDIVTCVDCVTEFKADCVDQLQVPEFVTPYPPECNVKCTELPPTGACPTGMEFNADGQTVDLDAGWTGLGHNARVPTNGRITLTVSGCVGTSQPDCGQCNVTGPLENTGGVAFSNHRCQDQPWVQCSTDGDCITAGATGPCIFFFGSPLPLVAGGVAACVVNEINGAVTGTINLNDGTSMTIVPLNSQVIVGGGGTFDPCPQCNAGLCSSGPRIGESCSVTGTTIQYGNVSLDCPPNPGSNVGTLPLNLNLGTATQSVTLSPLNPNCRDSGHSTLKCFCDTCNSLNTEASPYIACSANADCPDPAGPIGPICGGKRCLGGTNPGAACNGPFQCAGGANDFAKCSVASQCPGGACNPFCTVVCSGGTNAGNPCTIQSECPGICIGGSTPGVACIKGDCSPGVCSASCPQLSCNVPGQPTQPNGCLDDTSTPEVDEAVCQDNGNNQGLCAFTGERYCSIQKQQGCSADSECNPPSCPQCVGGQSCNFMNRSCFADNGIIGNSVSVAGHPDVPCGGIANPTVGALFCLAPVGSGALNVASGTPGLGRVHIPGVVVVNP